MSSPHLLIIEDDSDIAELLKHDLDDAGYRVSVATSVKHGLTLIRELSPDLILLDLGLPDGDGRQVLKHVRIGNLVPIIVLTARDKVGEKVELFDLGANDYLVKPFILAELLARIAVQFRRDAGEVLTLRELELRPDKRRVTVRGKELQLSPKEFDLLALLMRQPGRVYSRTDLIKEVWDGKLSLNSNVVDVHFANMRSKFRELELYGLFRTVRGYGYALHA
ncbi:response regulator transcription factor [Deinococcus altitudinis]|uniref:response regulator transcription factor n=1 Tax=Deinococcus altitudinis TaxID=468914 RepID=UPI0038918C11